MSARKKVAILEIAELNQRQKTEHLQRKNNELQIAVDTSAARIVELERNVKELSSANLDAQELEEKMRNQLLDSVKIEEYKQQLAELQHLRYVFNLPIQRSDWSIGHQIENFLTK